MIREGESVADAYARLGALRVRVKGLGVEKYNDGFEMNEAFIKSKVIAMIVVKQEDTNLALNLQIMTKSADLNSDDLVSYVATNENMAKAGKRLMEMNRVDEASHNHEASHNLALKARADHEREEDYEIEEDEDMTSTSDIATDFAFFAKKYKGKLPMLLNDKKKKRTCYNCDEESHFANECPYEKRVDKPKFIKGVKPRLKPNPINDRYKRNKGRAFIGAEYLSDEEEEDEEKDTTRKSLIVGAPKTAIAGAPEPAGANMPVITSYRRRTSWCASSNMNYPRRTRPDKVKDLETIERAQSLTQELNASKEELEVAHASLTRDLDHLERANKLVKDELKKLGENHDLLQETYSKALESMNDPIIDKDVASSSTSFTTYTAVSPPCPDPAPTSPPSPGDSQALLITEAEAMATFPVNPLAFLPEGMTIDQGPPDRKIHPIHLREQMREDVRDMLVESGHIVRYFDDHPFGLGVYTFRDTLTADSVSGLTFELDDITTITFVKHDEAKNMRLTTFGRETWFLYLGFPLNYQTTQVISSAVEDFGLMSIWQNPRGNNKFVLVRAAIVDPKFVPKTLVIHQLGGARRSWTVPVIMLRSTDWNAHEAAVPPPPEDPPSNNPHPLYGPDPTAENIYQHQLALWLQQNQQQHQGGGNNHGHQHFHQHVQQVVVNNNAVEQHLNEQAAMVHDHEDIQEAPPLFNFQAMLAEQGVPFEAGLPPPANNVTDSPLQAWTEMVDSPTSSTSSQDIVMMDMYPVQQMNFLSFDYGSFEALSAEIWAKVCLAKAAMSSTLAPSVSLDNTHHISFKIQMDSVMLYELVGEFYLLQARRKKFSKESSVTSSAATHMMIDYPMVEFGTSEECSDVSLPLDTKGKGKILTEPECTSQVRRSSRINKYDGFNHKYLFEARATKSKVKQRKVPAVQQKIQKPKKLPKTVILQKDPSVTAATPIPVLQAIGVNLCGVPPEELDEGRLLAPIPDEQNTALVASNADTV
ncbi:hypothetical protein QYE76_011901 [Lolium multiflorum]|uniref:CCHC-type domain-containing protein n=1 Tax=Lolium multiflorum TaxID=4521 RepID=A0AAD8U0N5_LOLMU|nr:hypothetical protein QYE76_011901 [Lolium multiflorum]